MALIERTHILDDNELRRLRAPRRDLLIEEPAGQDRWTMTDGPFKHYQRRLHVESNGLGPGGDVDGYRVVERTEYKLDLPLWWPYLWLPMRFGLAGLDRTPRRRWWWPREVVSADTARLIAHLGTIGMMAGYMGVLIGQTITFAAADFGVDQSAQADTLAAVRIGVLLSVVFLGRADRYGRRPLLLSMALAAIVFSVLAAFSPNIVAFGAAQTVARGLTTALLTLMTLASTEEVPASSRALSISFMTLTTGFGAALVIWVLPIADRFDGSWRLIYLVPLLFLPLLWWVRRNLPETRRYTAAVVHDAPGRINRFRFALIAGSALVAAVYLSPASQLRNEFLRNDLGYSATDISVFQLTVSIPATVAIPLAGILADRHGRRWLGASALAGSAIMSAISFQSSGWVLWVTAGAAVSLAAAAVPALRGYQTELFPTRARGRVGGLVDFASVIGSALGLVVVGRLALRWDDLGSAIGSMVWAPLLVAAVIIIAYPETANRELEEFNPDDPEM